MRKSFTLIELMLSVMILSVLILVMNRIVFNLKSSADILTKREKRENRKSLLIKTIYYDILNSLSIKVVHSFNSSYDRIYLQTYNSLYHLTAPYVVWYVSKRNKTLIRIESPFKINLPKENAFYLDKFANKVKIFKIFRKNGRDLIFIKAKEPVYFEMIDKTFKSQ